MVKSTNKTILLCIASLVINLILESRALAQIIPDDTLGTDNSRVNSGATVEGNSAIQIDGGARRETNLFHSFKEFNVTEQQRVYFSSKNGVENIFSRVTGNTPSEIQGLLGVIGNSADLFLINPNGIIFGPNAVLDVNGSFLASTADSLVFNDDFFSATNPKVPPLLTINVPVGLQFDQSAESIISQSAALDSEDFLIGLRVKAGNTLALVGGDIFLEGGALTTIDGRIEIGSIAAPGQVRLRTVSQGWALSYEAIENFQDIKLNEVSLVEAFDVFDEFNLENGIIRVQGQNIFVEDGSQLFADGEITVNAAKTINLIGTIETNGFTLSSGLLNGAISSKKAGDINVNTQKLTVRGGAFISTSVSGIANFDEEGNLDRFVPATGSGGNVTINASKSVELIDNDSGIFSSTEGFGKAGDIRIDTENLTIQNKALISAESTGVNFLEQPIETGPSGNIKIDAQNINLDDGSITAETRVGDEGNITLNNADTLLLNNNSQITTNAFQSATGGDIAISSDGIALLDDSDITANAVRGQGGNIQITTQGIFREPDSEITAASELGIDGTVTFNTPDVDPTSGIIELPNVPIDAETILAQNLCKLDDEEIAKGSSFIITGKGGLTPTSEGSLGNRDRLVNWVTRDDLEVSNNGTVGIRQRENSVDKSYPDIQQSQGLVVAADGSTWLTANAPKSTSQSTSMSHPDCQDSELKSE